MNKPKNDIVNLCIPKYNYMPIYGDLSFCTH